MRNQTSIPDPQRPHLYESRYLPLAIYLLIAREDNSGTQNERDETFPAHSQYL